MLVTKHHCGKTKPTEWKDLSTGRGIYVDVDTSSCNFSSSKPVVYTTTIEGDNNHWATTGATSLYKVTHEGFRVYIRWIDGGPLNAAFAEERGWHINWIGVQA